MGGTRGTGCKPRERNQFPSTARPARRREARAVLRRHCVHFLGGERAARIDYPHGICESGPRTQLVCILNFSTGKIGRKSAENATLRTLQIYKCSKCTRCSLARAPDRRAALSPVFCFFLLVSSCTARRTNYTWGRRCGLVTRSGFWLGSCAVPLLVAVLQVYFSKQRGLSRAAEPVAARGAAPQPPWEHGRTAAGLASTFSAAGGAGPAGAPQRQRQRQRRRGQEDHSVVRVCAESSERDIV